MMISAFCFFRVANRYTFGAIFGTDLVDPARREHYRQMVGDLVVSYLTSLLGRRSTTMWRSTERILVSHAGALPRPANLQRLFDAYPQEQDSFAAALPGAVREVVGQQVAAGADVVNDGEISKRGLFIGYIRDRMAGFEEVRVTPGQQRAANAGVTGRDRRDFPGFYAAGLGGFGGRPAATAQQDAAHSVSGTAYVCAGPLSYTGHAAVRADIDNLRAACRGRDAEPFLPAITPGTVEHWLRNEHYPDDESFLEAIAGVLHEEYKAITDAGILLQVDDPDLPDGWQMFPDMTVAQYREYAALRVEALNHALAGIPADQVRLHVCWGSQHGPHRDDIPLRDIIDLVLSVPAGCYSIEAANPRARARVGAVAGRQAASRGVADARSRQPRDRHHRAPGTDRPAADSLCGGGRRRERDRRDRLRPGRPRRPPGDSVGQARRPRRRRPASLAPAVGAVTGKSSAISRPLALPRRARRGRGQSRYRGSPRPGSG